MFGYKVVRQSDLREVCVLRGTQTHWNALRKWMVWALLLNSWGSSPHSWLQSLYPKDTWNIAHLNTFILSFKFYSVHALLFPINFDSPEPHTPIPISRYLVHDFHAIFPPSSSWRTLHLHPFSFERRSTDPHCVTRCTSRYCIKTSAWYQLMQWYGCPTTSDACHCLFHIPPLLWWVKSS